MGASEELPEHTAGHREGLVFLALLCTTSDWLARLLASVLSYVWIHSFTPSR